MLNDADICECINSLIFLQLRHFCFRGPLQSMHISIDVNSSPHFLHSVSKFETSELF